jgi:hypothetical protein
MTTRRRRRRRMRMPEANNGSRSRRLPRMRRRMKGRKMNLLLLKVGYSSLPSSFSFFISGVFFFDAYGEGVPC